MEGFCGKEVTEVSVTLFSVQSGGDIPLQSGRIGRFYGKDVTAVSVTLFSVQTGADIPLPNGKNKKILWQGCHCSFSDPIQCPNWS